jgi:hypothetical protein
MGHQEKIARRFLEINEMNPELESTIDAKLDFMSDLKASADATIRAHGGEVCMEESQWSDKQRNFVDTHGNDEEFGLVLFWACDVDGVMVYGLNPLTGIVPVKLD